MSNTSTDNTSTNNKEDILGFMKDHIKRYLASNGEDGPENYGGTNYSTNGTGAPFAFHPGGANFAFGDGSVHFLSEKTDIGVLIRLSTREAGDVVDSGAAGL